MGRVRLAAGTGATAAARTSSAAAQRQLNSTKTELEPSQAKVADLERSVRLGDGVVGAARSDVPRRRAGGAAEGGARLREGTCLARPPGGAEAAC